MRRHVCWLLLFAGCSAGPSIGSVSEAIIGGTTDDGDTAVMLIQAHVTGSTVAHLCSGSLISPHVLLTAAHCVDPATVGAGASFVVFDGTTATATSPPSSFYGVQATFYDTAFNPDMNVFPKAGHDIAVVVLRAPMKVTPLRYNHVPVPSALVGQPARIVGYGVTSGGSDTSSAGTRRQAPTKLASITDVLLNFEDGTHNICEGDSGGPAFMTIAGVETIAGLTAFGDSGCDVNTPGSDTRIDAWANFVDTYVTMYDPPATTGLAVGATCTTDLECTSKICAQIGTASFCSATCDPGAMNSCPTGLVCASLDESPLCAPSALAAMIHTGCDFSSQAPLSPSLPMLTLLLGALLWRRRRAR